MTKLKNDLLLRALRRQQVDRTPVWIMRQAGRYLPEYRKIREQAGSFMGLASNPELACEVTMQPLRRFPLDAAILFSDILTIPDAMGLGLYFATGEGPRFKRRLDSAQSIRQLPVPDPESDLTYVMDAVRLIRKTLDGQVPLIGFSGSPWTLATYMIEGGSSQDFRLAKGLLLEQPALAHELLAKLADSVTLYLNAQIRAGAQVVQLFDSWGGALAYDQFREFSLAYLERIVQGLERTTTTGEVPVILFAKGCHAHLEVLAETGCDALGLDWTISLQAARHRLADRVALQGNLDPAVLFSSQDTIHQQVATTLASYGPGNGHVFNLGHGIQPGVEPEMLGVLVDAVGELSPAYHQQAS